MPSTGIMASAVVTGTCTDVLQEPFNNLTAWSTTGSPPIVAGRTGNAVSLSTTSAEIVYTIAAGSRSPYITVGFAFRTSSISAAVRVIHNRNETTTLENSLYVSTAGALQFWRGTTAGTLLGASSTGAIAINTWYYIEQQIFVDDTAGYGVVRLNGTPVITVSGVDTKNSAGGVTATITNIDLQRTAPSTQLYDDLYISTGAGCAFKGDQAIP